MVLGCICYFIVSLIQKETRLEPVRARWASLGETIYIKNNNKTITSIFDKRITHYIYARGKNVRE